MDVVTLGMANANARKYLPKANTIVWLGDSHTSNGGGYTAPGTTGVYNSIGFWVAAQTLLGHRLRTVKNAGVAGETTAQILARVQTDVIAYKPGWCHELSGTNDVTQAVSLATIKANKTAIWDRLENAGIRVITGTIPPRSTWGGTQLADTLALNAWILEQGRTRQNLVVVDYFSALTNFGGTVFSTNMTTDGLHLSAAGAAYAGQLLAETLKNVLPANPSVYGASVPNLLNNGGFQAGGEGSVPTGWLWNGTPAPTYSRVPRTDGVGNVSGLGWQRLVVANGNSGNFQTNSPGITGINVGDLIVGTVEYSASNLDTAAANNTRYLYARLGAYNGVSFSSWAYDCYWQTGYGNHSPFARSGVFRTPPLVVPSGTTQLSLQIMIGGGGTYDFARAGAYNLTTQSLAI